MGGLGQSEPCLSIPPVSLFLFFRHGVSQWQRSESKSIRIPALRPHPARWPDSARTRPLNAIRHSVLVPRCGRQHHQIILLGDSDLVDRIPLSRFLPLRYTWMTSTPD